MRRFGALTESTSPGSRAAGKPLAPGVRHAMETRLGHSFGHVRVHADGHAAAAAREVGARAFAVGGDIVFGAGQLSAGTSRGRALLAHELAHVVQQGSPGDAGAGEAEGEARAASKAATSPRLRTGRRLALQAEDEAPADEAPMRAEHAAAAVMVQQERLSFVRDRVSAATYSIARGVAELRTRPEGERAPLRAKVHVVEVELARALKESAQLLAVHIPELEARAAAGEDLKAELAAARRQLSEARADLDTMRGVFSPAKGAAFEETYRTKVAGLHCMGAAYAGLGTLTSPEQAAEVKRQVEEKADAGLKRKRPVNLDQFITIMDTASADRIAGPKQRASWSRSHKRWTPTLDGIVRARVNTRVPGLYCFGLALAEAYHSVMIGVSTWEEPARMLWCDQHGCRTVAGTLDAFAKREAEGFEISYPDWDTYIWQVLPPAAASLLSTPEEKP
jgi:Domain of unknown function (DUF4157)